jgi:DNA-binding PadR family transcriptional regulator
VKNILDLVVLKAVDGGAMCGYDVIGYVHDTFHVLLSPGTVYPLLEAMEKHGILESELRGKKRYYILTKNGREAAEVVASEYMKVHRKLSLNRNKG